MSKGDGGGHNKGAMKNATAADLHRLYHDEEMSQTQIAEIYGVTQGAVRLHMIKHGVPARGRHDALILHGKSQRFSGSNNPRWTGGRHYWHGYVMVRKPDHPKAGDRGYVREHVLVWEETHGRPVPDGWHIHHKNGIKDDNRPENLVALSPQKHRDVIPALWRRIAELETELEEMKREHRT